MVFLPQTEAPQPLANLGPVAPHIARLRLTHFRSHAAADLSVACGAVILTGPNGIGKTNILEAISMLTPGRGLRSAQLEDMAATSADEGWTVLADIATATAPMRVGVRFAAGGAGRELRVDGAPARGFEKISMALPQLWLTPAMDRLFTDSAGGRRKFLDRFAQTLVPGLSTQLNQYERAMRERNKLLQMPGTQFAGNGWLDGLEENMASLGTAIAAARLAALDALADGLAAMPETVFPRAVVALEGTLEAALRAQPAIEVEDGWRARLHAARARCRRGAQPGGAAPYRSACDACGEKHGGGQMLNRRTKRLARWAHSGTGAQRGGAHRRCAGLAARRGGRASRRDAAGGFV